MHASTHFDVRELTSAGLAEQTKLFLDNIRGCRFISISICFTRVFSQSHDTNSLQDAIALANRSESQALMDEFLDRVFGGLQQAGTFPRMCNRQFTAAFLVGGSFDLHASTRIQEKVREKAHFLVETTDVLLNNLMDGPAAIDGFAGISRPLSWQFLSNYEVYRVTFAEFQRLKDLNLSVILLLDLVNTQLPETHEEMLDDDQSTMRLMHAVGAVVNVTLNTPVEDFTPPVCCMLINFLRQTLTALEAEILDRHLEDPEGAARLDALSTVIRSKLVALRRLVVQRA